MMSGSRCDGCGACIATHHEVKADGTTPTRRYRGKVYHLACRPESKRTGYEGVKPMENATSGYDGDST